MNENYVHPACPQGAEAGILQGMYLLRDSKSKAKARVQLLGSGTILGEVEAAAELLEKDWGVAADVWSATTSPSCAQRPRRDRWSMLHPESKPRVPYYRSAWRSGRGPWWGIDYIKALPTRSARSCRRSRPTGFSGTTASPLRLARQAAPLFRSEPVFRDHRCA